MDSIVTKSDTKGFVSNLWTNKIWLGLLYFLLNINQVSHCRTEGKSSVTSVPS